MGRVHNLLTMLFVHRPPFRQLSAKKPGGFARRINLMRKVYARFTQLRASRGARREV